MNCYKERASFDWSTDSIRHINTPTVLARHTYLYVQEAGYFKTFPPYFTERENLNSYLIILTLSGSGNLKYKGEEYTLCPGDIFYISCMDYHFYQCLSNNWEFLWIHFNGIGAHGYYDVFSKAGFRVIHLKDSNFLESTMRKILAQSIKKELHSEVLCSNLINTLITKMIICNSHENGILTYMPDYVRNIMKYLEEHYMDEFNLNQIAVRFGFSKYYISREFKKYVGITYSEYLITLRLNHAKELLKYTDLSINDITFQCGMNNVSHFINLFKNREEITPLQFRKEWKI